MVKTADTQLLETELLDLQRWEDEGGQVIENSDLRDSPLHLQLVGVPTRKHATSLQWNKRLVIEPFQPSSGILREDMNGKGRI